MAGKSRLDPMRLRELHAQGLHPTQASSILGCSPDAVSQQWFNMGLKWERKPDDLRRRLSDEQELEICRKYTEDGVGRTLLGREYDVDKGTIKNVLDRRGIGTRSTASRRTTYERKARIKPRDLDIRTRVENGQSHAQVAETLGVHIASVAYSLKKQGMLLPDETGPRVLHGDRPKNKGLGKGNREVPLDADLRHDYFDVLDPERAYWIGFLMGDVHVRTKGQYGQPRIMMPLADKDRNHVELLKSTLRTNTSIVDLTHVTAGTECHLGAIQFHSEQIANALAKVGVVDPKPARWVAPELANSTDFWRGLVDADGCVYLPGEGPGYACGQPPIMQAWIAFVESICGPGTVRLEVRDSLQVGHLRFQECGRTMWPLLYRNALVKLQRKYDRAMQWA
jgi:hypothetical protein